MDEASMLADYVVARLNSGADLEDLSEALEVISDSLAGRAPENGVVFIPMGLH